MSRVSSIRSVYLAIWQQGIHFIIRHRLRQKFLDAPEKLHAQQTVSLTLESLTTFTGIQFFYYLAFRRHRVANEVLDKMFLHFIQTELLVNANFKFKHHEQDDKKRHLI